MYMIYYSVHKYTWMGERGPAPSMSACILLTTSLSPSITSCLKCCSLLVDDNNNDVEAIVPTPPTTMDGGLCANEEGLPGILVACWTACRSLLLEAASEVVLSFDEESFLARLLRFAWGGTFCKGVSVDSRFWGQSPLEDFSLYGERVENLILMRH